MTATGSPFVGLDYFDETDAGIFFGRDAERQRIVGNLRAARLTLLYAESGVGKSSLLRAGVAARLRAAQRGYVPVVFSVWGGKPVERLMDEIETVYAAGGNGDRPTIRRDSLEHALEDAAKATQATPLVILDQFEEHFSYPGADADRFDDEISRCINRRDLRANFLISIREDAYSGIGDRFKARIPNVYGNYLHLDFLDLESARDAVERPIEAYNDARPGAARVEPGPGLVDTVVEQVRRSEFRVEGELAPDDAATRQVETGYLQLVMQKLWDAQPDGAGLTVETLTRLGGARKIVQNHLDGVMGGLTREQLPVAAKALRQLVTSSGRKIAMSSSELCDQAEVGPKALAPVLDHLTGKRILRWVPPTRPKAERRVEIFHDVLAGAILDWRRRFVDERTRHDANRRAVRNVLIAAVVALVLAAIAFAAVQAFTQAGEAERARNTAASLNLASLSDRQLDTRPDLALLFALDAYRASPLPQARNSLLAAYSAAWSPGAGAIMGGHTDFVSTIAFSPDGLTLATASNDKTIRFWDVGTHRQLGRPMTGHTAAINRIAYAPDGRTLASSSNDGTIRFWDVATRRRSGPPLKPATIPFSLAFSPDGTLLASGGRGPIRLFDARTRRPVGAELSGHKDWVRSLVFASNGRLLMSAGLDKAVYFWKVRSRRWIGPLRRKASINAAAWSKNRDYLALATASEGLWLYEIGRGGAARSLAGDSQILSVAFSNDNKTIAVGGYKTIRLYDARTRKQIGPVLNGHANWVNGVVFSPDGRTLASASSDQTVRLWDIEAHSKRAGALTGHEGFIRSVAFSRDGTRLVSTGDDRTLRLWDVRTQRQLGAPLVGHTQAVQGVAFSLDGTTIVSGGVDETVRVWDAATHKQLGDPIAAHSATVKAVAFRPGGRSFASASDDGMVRLWDTRTRRQLGASIRASENFVNAIAFSPDGGTLVTGSGDKTVGLWDVRKRRRIGRPLTGYGAPVTTVAFSPDGKLLAAGGTERYIVLWDVATRRQIGGPLAGHSGTLTSLAFSRDSRTLASTGTDNTVRLWDVRSRLQLGPALAGHSLPVRAVAFSPDGRVVASGGDDRTIILSPGVIWQNAQGLRTQICALVRTRLSREDWSQYVQGVPYRAACP